MAPANTYLSFYGVGFTSGVQKSFQALCGANPPTVTGGYAVWNKVKLPMQRSLTTLDSYDPAQLTCEVIFGQFDPSQGWMIDPASAALVEQYIGDLEWMAGSNFHSGPSPVVYVKANATGGQSNLIPPQYQNMPWIVSSLTWGKAYRNAQMSRVYQEATIVLENYLNFSKPPQADENTQGGYFASKPGRDTALLIAGAPSTNSPMVDHQTLARRILADPQNNPCRGTSIKLQRRSVTWQIRHTVPVWVPGHQIA